MPDRTFLAGIDVTIELAGLKRLHPIAFSAQEAIGRPYTLQLTVETPDNEDAIDLGTALGLNVNVVIEQELKEMAFSGIIRRIEHIGSTPQLSQVYRIEAVPPLALASLNLRCQVYSQLSIPDLIIQVLAQYQISPKQSLSADYPILPHVMQYEETDLDFITRLMEQEGMSYFFTFDDAGKPTMVITDGGTAHPNQGLEVSATKDLLADGDVVGPVFSQSIPLKGVTVKDYDPKHPGTSLSETATLAIGATAAATGQMSEYNTQFAATQDDAKRYAAVRLQQFACTQRTGVASSHIFRIRSGYLLTLSDHPVASCNGQYLVLDVAHEVRQTGYQNRFTLLPTALLPYRLPLATPIPRIPGFLLGRVATTAGSHNDLEVDGAYAVSLTAEDQTSSRVVRMAQPYGGPDRGMHFPIPPSTEILLGHVNGDPNRPVIAGTLPNTDAPSVVKHANNTQSVLQSSVSSSLIFEDDANTQHVALTSGGGHQLKMMDAGENPLVNLSSKGGHALTLDDTSSAPVILLKAAINHFLKLDGTASAPKTSLVSSSGHELVLDDSPGAGNATLTTKGKHSLAMTDKAGSGKIALTSGGGHSITLDDTTGSGALSLKSSGGASVVLNDAIGSEAVTLKGVSGNKLDMQDVPPSVTLSSNGTLTIKALESLTIQVGSASIAIDSSGNISLTGLAVKINGESQLNLAAPQVAINGDATVAVKGGVIQLN